MKQFKKIIAIFIGLMVTFSTAANAQDIRIGLKYGSRSPKESILQNTSGFLILSGETLLTELAETKVTVSWNAGGTITVINPADGTPLYSYEKCATPLQLAPRDGGTVLIDGKEYRGKVQFLYTDNGLTVINFLDIEDYLKGVIASEMPSSWPTEALKAQAVCARNFAMTNRNKFQKYGFDLDDTTQTQVYSGVKGETSATNQAVAATKNIYLVYEGNIATTFFFSSSGGHTESSKYVWGGDYPYLIGVEDPYDTSRAWTVPYSPEEIKEKLAGIGVNIGNIINLEIVELSPSGRIIDLKIIGTNGDYHAKLEAPRSLFNLHSNLFTITKEGGTQKPTAVITATGLEERILSQPIMTATGTITPDVGTPTGYIFNGTGFGHGVGMSQYGAKGMAEQGYSYEQILKHYFTGTALQEIVD